MKETCQAKSFSRSSVSNEHRQRMLPGNGRSMLTIPRAAINDCINVLLPDMAFDGVIALG